MNIISRGEGHGSWNQGGGKDKAALLVIDERERERRVGGWGECGDTHHWPVQDVRIEI